VIDELIVCAENKLRNTDNDDYRLAFLDGQDLILDRFASGRERD